MTYEEIRWMLIGQLKLLDRELKTQLENRTYSAEQVREFIKAQESLLFQIFEINERIQR